MGKHIGCDVDWQLLPEGTVFYSEDNFRNEKGDWWSEVWGRWCSTQYTVEELTQANDYEPKPNENKMEDTERTRLAEQKDVVNRVDWTTAPDDAEFYAYGAFRKQWCVNGNWHEAYWDTKDTKWVTTIYVPLQRQRYDHPDFEVAPPVAPVYDESLNDKWDSGELGREEEFVKVSEEPTQWTATHYDNYYQLTSKDIEAGKVKIDAYFVNKMWKLNQKDDTGGLFHSLKTIARFGEKNSIERELKALYNQTKRMAELYGVELE